MVDRKRRRDVIRGIGVAGIAGLAGCGGGGNGNGGNGNGGNGNGGNGGNGNGNGGNGNGGNGNGNGGNGNGGNGNGNGGNGNGMSGGARTIKLGMLMGVTGGLEELGPPIRDAAQLVPQQVNDADTDFSVDTQFEDTATSPTEGVSGAEALVNAGYPMICGALSSEVSLQVAQNVTIPNSVTQCSPASTAPDFTTLEDNDFFFRTPPTDALQGQVLANIAAQRMGHSAASTLYLNNAYGNGLAQGFENAFKDQHSGDIQASVSFSKGQSSYTSQLQTVLNNDPDVVLVVGYPESGNQIFRDFYSNFNARDTDVLVSDGLQDPNLPGNVGYDMSNVSGTAPSGEGPGLEFFNNLYSDTYDTPAEGAFIRQAYDAAAVLVLANAAAGENDGASVRDNMRTVAQGDGEEITPENLVDGIEMAANGEAINYQGVSGPVEFDENGDLATATYVYFQFTSDGLETVDTITP